MPMQLLQKTLQGYRAAEHQTVINAAVVSCSLFSFKKKKKRFTALFVNVHYDIWTYCIRGRAEIPNQTHSKANSSFANLIHPENKNQWWSNVVQISWHAPQTVTDLLQLSDHVC